MVTFMAITPSSPQSQHVNWHVRGEAAAAPEPEPNCMGRIIRYLRNAENPLLLKIGAIFLAAAAMIVATVLFKIKLTIAAIVVLPMLIWGRTEWMALTNQENAAIASAEARRQRLIEQQTSFTAMQEACGGEAAFNQLPVLDIGNREGSTGYIDFLRPADLTAPIMRGTDRYGRPFISMKLHERATGGEAVITIFQRYVEGGRWTYGGNFPSPGNFFNGVFTDQDRALIRQIVVDRNNPRYDLAT